MTLSDVNLRKITLELDGLWWEDLRWKVVVLEGMSFQLREQQIRESNFSNGLSVLPLLSHAMEGQLDGLFAVPMGNELRLRITETSSFQN
jgi:hypothetical protein